MYLNLCLSIAQRMWRHPELSSTGGQDILSLLIYKTALLQNKYGCLGYQQTGRQRLRGPCPATPGCESARI